MGQPSTLSPGRFLLNSCSFLRISDAVFGFSFSERVNSFSGVAVDNGKAWIPTLSSKHNWSICLTLEKNFHILISVLYETQLPITEM